MSEIRTQLGPSCSKGDVADAMFGWGGGADAHAVKRRPKAKAKAKAKAYVVSAPVPVPVPFSMSLLMPVPVPVPPPCLILHSCVSPGHYTSTLRDHRGQAPFGRHHG